MRPVHDQIVVSGAFAEAAFRVPNESIPVKIFKITHHKGFLRVASPLELATTRIDKLNSFEKIRSRSLIYHVQNSIAVILASERFWLSTVAATIFAIAYFGTW